MAEASAPDAAGTRAGSPKPAAVVPAALADGAESHVASLKTVTFDTVDDMGEGASVETRTFAVVAAAGGAGYWITAANPLGT